MGIVLYYTAQQKSAQIQIKTTFSLQLQLNQLSLPFLCFKILEL